MPETLIPSQDEILKAADHLRKIIIHTPFIPSQTIAEQLGAKDVRIKAESMQWTGSFKVRGAYWRCMQLTEAERKVGVVAYSSGNFAQGLAAAADLLEIPATIVMPIDAPEIKQKRTAAYGANIVLSDHGARSREEVASEIAQALANDELASTADVVSSKILYAAGYNVPRNSAVYFKSDGLKVGTNIPYPDGQGGKRAMTQADLDNLIATIASREDGRIRCLASKLIEGKPIGIFNFQDRRSTDANDRVEHQHRRELRGLRVISSWINDVDRRAANTLNMFVKDQNGHGYVKHYLIDMGASLGSSSIRPRTPKSGNEYFVDLRQIIPATLGLGLYHKEWEDPLPMKYASIGYLESEVFSPARWVTNYPNPAFQRCTARDGYWGAKIVMSFTNAHIETLVKSSQLSNPGAEKELIRLLQERRDKIGRYWFSKINPLDHFWIDREGLYFEDLAIKGNLAQVKQTTYTYRILNNNGTPIGQNQNTSATQISIPSSLKDKQYHSIEIRTQRPNASPKPTRIFFYKWDSERYQIVKVERDT